MSVIKVRCEDQRLLVTQSPVIASGDVNTDRVYFDFSEEWNNFTKIAVFFRDKGVTYYHDLLDENVEAVIPKEVLQDEGYFYFGVTGVNKDDDTQLLTSQIIKYRVVKGAVTDAVKPPEITPTDYEQLVAQMTKLGQIFNYATEDDINNLIAGDTTGNGVVNITRLNQYSQKMLRTEYTDNEYDFGG